MSTRPRLDDESAYKTAFNQQNTLYPGVPRGGVAASVSPSPEGPADLLAVGHRDPCGSPGVLSQPGPWGPGPAVLKPSPVVTCEGCGLYFFLHQADYETPTG